MAKWAGDLILCKGCLSRGVKKKILINRTETCIECRSNPCKKCGTLTTSKDLKCYKCAKPKQWAAQNTKRAAAKQQKEQEG